MKIMLIDVYKIVNYAGGIEHVLCDFANEFSRRGHKVSIVCLDIEKGTPLYPLYNNVKFVNLCYEHGKPYNQGFKFHWVKIEKEILRTFGGKKLIIGGKRRNDPKKEYFYQCFTERLKKCVREDPPDVVLGASPDASLLTYKVLSSVFQKSIPQISMCHVNPYESTKNMTDEEIDVWRKISAVQVLMPSFVNAVKKVGVKNVVCIPNTVTQIPIFKRTDLLKCHHNIISVGRVEHDVKRPHLLLEAFSKIADSFPDWQLHIYGDVSNKRYVKKLKRFVKIKKLENQIFFDGPTTNIYDKLRKSDIFVTTSASEGFGLAATEAMSMGVPVIAYKNTGALSDLIHNGINGYLCDDGIENISRKLSYLMKNQALRVFMGKNAGDSVVEYTPKIVWDKWESILYTLYNNN